MKERFGLKIKHSIEDKLFSEFVRKKSGGVCEYCQKPVGYKRLQASHYFGRRNKSLRWDERNVSALCFTCHMVIMTENPFHHTKWMKKKLGTAGFGRLVRTSNRIKKWTKQDLKALRVDLRKKIKELE
tara:strand:- start:437 stop:820 length:384 start_codon:yes stop_codon:yes gene_type:complete